MFAEMKPGAGVTMETFCRMVEHYANEETLNPDAIAHCSYEQQKAIKAMHRTFNYYKTKLDKV